jgi:large subunit ribosomal protein L1
MGKIRVKTLGDEEAEKKQKEELKRKKEAKIAEGKAEASAKAAAPEKQEKVSKEAPVEEAKANAPEEKTAEAPKAKTKKEKFQKKEKAYHSVKYFSLSEQVDRKKTYSLLEALGLLEKLQRSKFDETVELHLNTVSTGISGNVTLPHGTGKKTRVAVASDAIIAEVEKGIINFDVLVADPSMMPKLAKIARVLGPRGLMPNPKNGTITSKPEEVVKKYEGGQISFKTEAKAPIMHLTVGKVSFGPKKLEENIDTMIKAIKKANIANATLKSTMSPGIKVQV